MDSLEFEHIGEGVKKFKRQREKERQGRRTAGNGRTPLPEERLETTIMVFFREFLSYMTFTS